MTILIVFLAALLASLATLVIGYAFSASDGDDHIVMPDENGTEHQI